ncbi:hypothetical protein CCH79_00003820 [Gambusia affinis]|uniref:Uncharacterized protein n=1 Tax=Gambusia affinis TaxID=33528 RepID=A0A315V9Y9_GAMAF|nr:hypothetical protein CCH79_00003820 [Gambusia affinis]
MSLTHCLILSIAWQKRMEGTTASLSQQSEKSPAEFRGFKSLLAMSGALPDTKKLTQKAAEHRSQPYTHTNPLTQRELPITHTFDKLAPAALRIKTMETHSVQEQPEEEILVRAAEQGPAFYDCIITCY